MTENEEYEPGNKVAYGFGAFADIVAYQVFTFLVFTFYYAVVGIDINLVTLGFVLWSVWNAINDPLSGLLSDRTNTKWGRRVPFIAAGSIPLSLLMFFMWTPPTGNVIWSFAYFLIAICLFDGIYTVYSLNLTALFPEMYLDKEERASANNIRQIFNIFGLIVAFIVPTLLISDLSAKDTAVDVVLAEYRSAGVVIAIIVLIGALITVKWGISEREEFSKDFLSVPNVTDAFKHTLGNRSFQCFLVAITANWYVFGLIPTIVPLYGQFVLGIGTGQSVLLGILLAAAFLSGGACVSLWKYVVNRWEDLRKAWIASMVLWIAALIPFILIENVIVALICFVLNGFGLSGSLYLKDLVISDIIDEDELKTGVRREGAFFGMNALIMRFSVIMIFLSINMVFNSVGWKVFTPDQATPDVLFGLRLLMSVFPCIALLFGIIGFSRYPLVGERLKKVKQERDGLHKEKAGAVERAPKPTEVPEEPDELESAE